MFITNISTLDEVQNNVSLLDIQDSAIAAIPLTEEETKKNKWVGVALIVLVAAFLYGMFTKDKKSSSRKFKF